MRIIGRWAARHSTHAHVRAGSKMPDHGFQPAAHRLAEAERQGQHEERHAGPGYQGCSGAKPLGVPAVELDQQQAAVVLAALEDAAALRREATGNCPDCRSADERICTDHEGGWKAADEYDSLRWHLDSTHRDCQPNRDAEAASASTAAEQLQPEELDVDGHGNGSGEHRAAVLGLGQAGLVDDARPEEDLAPAAPDSSRSVSPELYNAIADSVREVNKPKFGPNGEPYTSPEVEGSLAGWPGARRTDPGGPEDQITGRNEADDHEPDREAGE